MLFTSIGVIQRDAPPLPLFNSATTSGTSGSAATLSKEKEKEISDFQNHMVDMANQISQTAKTINKIIDSLPGANSTEEEQLKTLQELEIENLEIGHELRKKVAQAELWRNHVREALHEITSDKLQEL